MIDRLWRYIDIDGPNGCWLWRGAFSPYFYGEVMLPSYGATRSRKHEQVHRIFFEYYLNFMPDTVMHRPSCPRNCCNPAHLRDGTIGENWKEPAERRYPMYSTAAARSLREQLARENHKWKEQTSERDHKAIRAIAEERLASELLSFGNNCEEEF